MSLASHSFLLIVCGLLAGIVGLASAAQPAAAPPAELEVGSVRFSNLRASSGADGNAYEADVALEARPAPGTPGRMIMRVQVTLTLCFELPAPTGGERRLEFYRSEAECVGLETGTTHVRFYLPPELVKRDQLRGDPKYWGVELTVGGRAVPGGRTSYSTSLPGAEARKSFQTRATAAVSATDGLLLPQYLTPFVHDYPRATPSFVRRDGR